MTLEAKPVIKNKFWIVEEEGQKVATIQATPEGVVLVKDSGRESFPNIKLLSAKYNIHVGRAPKSTRSGPSGHDIYGFPTNSKPFNELYDVRRKLPFYTKAAKSKSYFCAGYYAVMVSDQWTEHFCPKSITLGRYEFKGPFKTIAEVRKVILNAKQP